MGKWELLSTKRQKKEVLTIYLVLDDSFAGRTRINGNDIITKNNSWVPIERRAVNIPLQI